MSTSRYIRNFKAEAAIPAFTIVKNGTVDGNVLQATAIGDKLLGVSTDIAAAINERCDIILAGPATILFGGPVARGDLLTSDATGRAVTAAPAAGVNNRIIGIAMVSGVVGDIGQMIVSQGSAQG